MMEYRFSEEMERDMLTFHGINIMDQMVQMAKSDPAYTVGDTIVMTRDLDNGTKEKIEVT